MRSDIEMAIKKENLKLLLIGAIVLIFLGAQNTIPKRAVADVEGLACVEDKNCPCWGKVTGTDIEAFGIGTATCNKETLKCDTSFCVDVQPVAEWAKKNPWQWAKNNIMMVVGIIGLLAVLALWPKQ